MKKVLSIFLVLCLMFTVMVVALPAVAEDSEFTVTYHYADGTTDTDTYAVDAAISYPALVAKKAGDNVWSASETEYVAVADKMSGADYHVYEYLREGFFGFDNYYDYADKTGIETPHSKAWRLTAENGVMKFVNDTTTNSSVGGISSADRYNVIALGKVAAGKSATYKITLSYEYVDDTLPLKYRVYTNGDDLYSGVTIGGKVVQQPSATTYFWKELEIPTDKNVFEIEFTTTADLVDDPLYDGTQKGTNLYLWVGTREAGNCEVNFDYIKVEEVVGVTYNYADGSKTADAFAPGAAINYVSPTPSKDGDNVWSESPDAYVSVSETMPDSVYNVYEYLRKGYYGFDNYYNYQDKKDAGRSGTVADGTRLIAENGVLKFDNSIPTYKSDGTVNYQGLNGVDRYNSIALGSVAAGRTATYKITYKYKIDASTSPLKFIFYTSHWQVNWNNTRKIYETINLRTVETNDEDYRTGVLYLTVDDDLTDSSTSFSSSDLGNCLFMYVGTGREDDTAKAYFEEITVEELPSGTILFDPNVSAIEPVPVSGEEGDTYTVPDFKNGRSELLGWYLDKECTVPFTSTTVPAGVTRVYAKWSVAPITFETYPYADTMSDKLRFGVYTLFIKNEENAGYDDDYALNFIFDGDTKCDRGGSVGVVDMCTRAQQKEHVATIGTVKDGALYRVTYYYKTNASCETGYSISIASGNQNIMDAAHYKKYSNTTIRESGEETDWIKVEQYFVADLPRSDENYAYIQFHSSNSTLAAYANVYVDNIMLEEIPAPYLFFDANNNTASTFLKGEVGQTINFPTPTQFGKSFTGWYTDAACTTRYTGKTFAADTALTLYAGWEQNKVVTYNFENYDIPYKATEGTYQREDCYVVENNDAFSGNHVLEFDRSQKFNGGGSQVAVADGRSTFTMDPKNDYLVTIKFKYVNKEGKDTSIAVFGASSTNYWNNKSATFPDLFNGKNMRDVSEGQWLTAGYIIKGEELKENGYTLYIRVGGGEGDLLWIDDVTVTTIEPGQSAVLIHTGYSNDVPQLLIGKEGQSYANKLPTNPRNGSKKFIGYYEKDSRGYYNLLDNTQLKFDKDIITIYARFIDTVIKQNFEGASFHNQVNAYTYHTTLDFDYEIYDSQKQGNSKDNVTSGRYSLHRRGTTAYNENALVLTFDNRITEGQRYTVTFKVKMGDYKHTNGAVKIVSGKNYTYQWSTRGDYYPVIAIADLTDGQWHEVTYTFNATEPYVVVQTPGYVELFMDDFVFTLVDENTPVSSAVKFTEYVQAHLDESGNLIVDTGHGIDVGSIIDASLSIDTDDGNANMIILIAAIGGGVVLLLVALAVVLLVKRKKKKAKV